MPEEEQGEGEPGGVMATVRQEQTTAQLRRYPSPFPFPSGNIALSLQEKESYQTGTLPTFKSSCNSTLLVIPVTNEHLPI